MGKKRTSIFNLTFALLLTCLCVLSNNIFSKVLMFGDTLFHSTFNATSLTGDLRAYAIDENGNISISSTWSAAAKLQLKTAANRAVIFSTPGTETDVYEGKAFIYENLDTVWKDALKTNRYTMDENSLNIQGENTNNTAYEQAMLLYLRGDSTNENKGFRPRDSKLGTIINSAPVYVGIPAEIKAPYSGDSLYDSFKSANSARNPMVYIGANDGMLHAFDAASGEEKLAYISSQMKDRLNELANPDVQKQYYFDGDIQVKDVYINSTWKTVLIAAFGKGKNGTEAKGLAALDITNPSNFSEANAASLVMWEFNAENKINDEEDNSSTTDIDVGSITDAPLIVKLNTGKWGVIVGNGLNSGSNTGSSGKGVLYILDIATGKIIKKIEVTGDSQNLNGITATVAIDISNNGIVDYVYATDLKGNLWKFDLTSSNSNDWNITNNSSPNTSIPIFSTSSSRPILSGITVGKHSTGIGRMLYFGTGLPENNTQSDENIPIDKSTQAIYGIWDYEDVNQASYTILESSLLKQTVTYKTTFTATTENNEQIQESNAGSITTRETTQKKINWQTSKGWFLELKDPSGNNYCERVLEKPQLRHGKIIFTTALSVDTSCEGGMTKSWFMMLDAANGGNSNNVIFDFNGDNKFTTHDYSKLNGGTVNCITESCIPPSGLIFDQILTFPFIATDKQNQNRDVVYLGAADGIVKKITTNSGGDRLARQSWVQIFLQDSK